MAARDRRLEAHPSTEAPAGALDLQQLVVAAEEGRRLLPMRRVVDMLDVSLHVKAP